MIVITQPLRGQLYQSPGQGLRNTVEEEAEKVIKAVK